MRIYTHTHKHTCTQPCAHSDRPRLRHTSQIQTQTCTRTNAHIDRRSHRHRYAHACMPHTGTHRHTHRPVQKLAPTGSTLRQASGSGGGAADPCGRCHLLPPGATRPAEGARGPFPPGPAAAGGGACGRHPPSQARSALFPSPGGSHCAWGPLSHRILGALLGLAPLGPGDELGGRGAQHRDGSHHKKGELAHHPGPVVRTMHPPGPSQACSSSLLPTICPRVC